jgi:hypothetical protein
LRDNFRKDLEESMNFYIDSSTQSIIDSLKLETWAGDNFVLKFNENNCLSGKYF